ncbi:MAG: biotin synthase BioB [Candidatus Omnitrophota bacterium]|nr:biotin synthase BioB [Candidatus Omnitrophota bacterium]
MELMQAEYISSLPLEQLLAAANEIRREILGNHIEICGIVNAKSGRCGEDCKFCAQSAHYAADVEEYPLLDKEELVNAARAASENGADRFGIVTSGKGPGREEIEKIADSIREIRKDAGISVCASLGVLDERSFVILREAGLSRYHHNIETSESFYPQIVTTHDYGQRINTIKNAKKADIEVCSGGIIGMGETWQDRIDMALLLKELEVESVPLNFLVPIKGTPLENAGSITPLEALRVIALFRIILKKASIKIIAGRESVLKDFQGLMYMAGADGMMVGGYLTIAGRSVEEDRALVEEIKKLWSEE